jgi:hypothetical protein
VAVAQLSLENLVRVDGGRLAAAFDLAIKRCVLDCEDRPGLDKARKVMLVVELKPAKAEDGNAYEVDFAFAVKDTAPQRNLRKLTGVIRRGGVLAWNDDSPDDPNQMTLDEEAPGFGDE